MAEYDRSDGFPFLATVASIFLPKTSWPAIGFAPSITFVLCACLALSVSRSLRVQRSRSSRQLDGSNVKITFLFLILPEARPSCTSHNLVSVHLYQSSIPGQILPHNHRSYILLLRTVRGYRGEIWRRLPQADHHTRSCGYYLCFHNFRRFVRAVCGPKTFRILPITLVTRLDRHTHFTDRPLSRRLAADTIATLTLVA